VPTAPLDDAAPATLARPGDQESRLDVADRTRLVRQALRRLSDKEREAVVLRDIEGLSTAQTARSLGCLEVTVRSHLSRGRLKLQAAIELAEGGGR
jgi:RNA polymerase sigma-70 factor (ECF subfamily)